MFQTAIFLWDFPALILWAFLCYLPVMYLYNYRWRVSFSHMQILSSTERNQMYLSYSDTSGAINLRGVSGAEFCDSLCGKVTLSFSFLCSITVLCSTSSHVTGLYEHVMFMLACFFSQWNLIVKHWMIIMWEGFASKLLCPVLSNSLRICLNRLWRITKTSGIKYVPFCSVWKFSWHEINWANWLSNLCHSRIIFMCNSP